MLPAGRPQLGRTWCCPCLAQVAYGETQTFMQCEGVFCSKMEVVEKGNVESSHETVSSGGVQGKLGRGLAVMPPSDASGTLCSSRMAAPFFSERRKMAAPFFSERRKMAAPFFSERRKMAAPF